MSACVGAVVKDKIITSLKISLRNEINLFLVVLVWVPPQQVLRPDEDLSVNNLLGRRRKQEREVGRRQRR